MRIRAFCIAVLLALAACARSGDHEETGIRPPLEHVLTLVATIGTGESAPGAAPDDFMLARPGGIAVDREGNLLIVDEDYVKIFDPEGRPQTLLGGKGEGPGEFNRIREIWYSPNGYFTVFGDPFGFTAHYFRPDRSFIRRVNYMSERPFADIMASRNLIPQRPERVFCFGEHDYVYSIDSTDMDRANPDHQEVFLFHETADTLRVVANYTQTHLISGPRMGYGFPFLGNLLVVPLPHRRIAYTHPHHDTDLGGERPAYTITILDLETMERRLIRHAFERQPIDWEPTPVREELRQRNPDQARDMEELNRITTDRLAEVGFQVPLSALVADGEFLFAVTNKVMRSVEETEEETGEAVTMTESLVDVFNAQTGVYIASAWMPAGGRSVIRAGYLYVMVGLGSSEAGPSVRKYRIDPAVYGH